jgi:hypothetical protein
MNKFLFSVFSLNRTPDLIRHCNLFACSLFTRFALSAVGQLSVAGAEAVAPAL